jgi:hypothetical protein
MVQHHLPIKKPELENDLLESVFEDGLFCYAMNSVISVVAHCLCIGFVAAFRGCEIFSIAYIFGKQEE